MRLASLALVFVVTFLVPTPAASQTLDELAMQVRAAEIAFARTMADRDPDAFITHVSAEAVFFGDFDVHRGIDEIRSAWRRFFEGDTAPFSWAPERVEVLDSGTLALSTGPVRDPDGQEIGTFSSIWHLEADGVWRVVFDKGCP
jgi:ketosteroid isomerase-like protein